MPDGMPRHEQRHSSCKASKAKPNLEKTNEKPKKEEKKKEKEKKNECREMQLVVGLVGRKFNIDELDKMKYQPWDCVSVSEGPLSKYAKNIEKRTKVIEYCRGSIMKVYPRGTRFDSSNCDSVKSWICGAQIAALNLQSTEDDYVLLNKIFFKMYNGLGFVPRPEFLVNPKAQIKTYKSPCMNLFIKLISGIMLQNILKVDGVIEKIKDIAVSFKIIGSFEDDKENKEYSSDYINQNFINPIFLNTMFNFKIYETELSFLVIKIFSGKYILARSIIPLNLMEEGVKLVTLYDNQCKEIENSMLALKVTKTPLFQTLNK